MLYSGGGDNDNDNDVDGVWSGGVGYD